MQFRIAQPFILKNTFQNSCYSLYHFFNCEPFQISASIEYFYTAAKITFPSRKYFLFYSVQCTMPQGPLF